MSMQLLPRLGAWLAYRYEAYRLNGIDRRILADMGFDPDAPEVSLRRRARAITRKG